MYTEFEIRQVPLTLQRNRQRVEQFLSESQLRLDDVDYYAGVFRVDDDELLAGGGLKGNVIKCIAVSSNLREEGLSSRLLSHLISRANSEGHQSVKLFTKPSNLALFQSLGFRLLAEAPQAILMETGTTGLQAYKRYLRSLVPPITTESQQPTGVIVMNANPFTLGHRFLIEQAAAQVSHLFVICVREDCSVFSYADRLAMLRTGTADLPNVTTVEGSDYAISAATFPTYFLKQLSDVSDTQMTLDLNLFARHIAPTLNASMRFVGSEPNDALTRRYNELMHELLPQQGIQVVEVARAEQTGRPVSASTVRRLLDEGSLHQASALVHPSTRPFLLAHLATRALRLELATTPKPGLVDHHDSGSHHDMNYALMERSIEALQPFFVQLANLELAGGKPVVSSLQTIGLMAEDSMFAATGGVNTHKGALFSMGLTIVAAAMGTDDLQTNIIALANQFTATHGTHGTDATTRYGIKGALANAQEGYWQLFDDWLPYYRSIRTDEHALHKTLLRIMATLDDTNIYHRTDRPTAQWVKQQAVEVLQDFSIERLQNMNAEFIRRNISPGGCADMLALTLFIDSITVIN